MPNPLQPIRTLSRLMRPLRLAAALPWLAAAPAMADDGADQDPSTVSLTHVFEPAHVFEYVTGAQYAITSSALHVTDLALQPGEEIRGQIAVGDSVRWVVSVDKEDSAQQHVFIKPSRPGLSTNMIVRTNRRAYLLDLHSGPADAAYMFTVRWSYPADTQATGNNRS